MAPKKDTSKKARNWMFTLNNYEDKDIERLANPCEQVKYIAYGKEVGEFGTLHLQGYIICWEPQRLSFFKKQIPRAHVEIMRGRLLDNDTYVEKEGDLTTWGQKPDQGRRADIVGLKRKLDSKGSLIHNRDYCSNEGKLTELDVKPQDNGRKRTLSEYKGQIDDGKDVHALAAAIAFPRYRSALQEYAHYVRGGNMQTNREVPEVNIRVGPPGTGQNRWLDEQYGVSGWIQAPDNKGKWYDGCDTRDVVVFNGVGRNCVPPLHVFMKITDRYPIQRPVKRGFIWFKPKVLVFTSISHPFEWWPNLSEADKDGIMRRVTSITHRL